MLTLIYLLLTKSLFLYCRFPN